MPLKRTSHAVYDTKYHVVWAPKYRKWIDREDIRRRVEQLFRQIVEDLGFEIEELEVAKDHVHIFLSGRIEPDPAMPHRLRTPLSHSATDM